MKHAYTIRANIEGTAEWKRERRNMIARREAAAEIAAANQDFRDRLVCGAIAIGLSLWFGLNAAALAARVIY